MLRIPLTCLVLSLTWVIAPVAHAIPLNLNEVPKAEMGLSPAQWAGSEQLTDVVKLLEKGARQQAKEKLAVFLKRSPNDPRGPALAGMILMEDKNYPAAVLSFERALVLHPKNPDLLAKLGVAQLLQNNNKAGEAVLRQAIALQPGEPLARRYLGWLEERRGNLNAAGQHYLAALKGGHLPAGSFSETHLALGRLYTALGRNEQTVRLLTPYLSRPTSDELKQALQIQLALAYLELQRGQDAAPLIKSLERTRKSDDPELQFVKAYALLDSNAGAARKQLQDLAQAQPAFTGRTRMLIARSYAREGKTALAAKELEALAAQVDPGDLPEVLTALTALYVSSGNAAEATKILEGYARKNQATPEIPYLLAEVRLQAKDVARTQSLLKQLIATHPDFAPAYNLLGQIERSQNALPQAEAHLAKAATLDGTVPSAWINLAGVHVSRNNLSKAEATLREGLKVNPGNALLEFELANIYDAMGKSASANALYKSIIAAYPGYLPALNNIALNLAESGDLDNARSYAKKAYQADPQNPAIQDTYGWVLVLGGDLANGMPLLNEAAQALPKDPTVMYHLGSGLVKAGKSQEGKQYVQRALAAGLPASLQPKAKALVNAR